MPLLRGTPRKPGGTPHGNRRRHRSRAHRSAHRARRGPPELGDAAARRACTSARARSCRRACRPPTRRASPHPIFLERGSGSKVWDVDGSEYRDFHNGFGSMVQGHAHPRSRAPWPSACRSGTHFAATTEDSVVVAEELARRWGLPKWRFTNSGSESTMDAIRLARAHTGRELVIKMEGSYHGHHDTVMVSIGIDIDDDAVGPANRPNSVPYGGGIPACHRREDDPGAVQRRRRARRAPGRARGQGRLRDHGAGHDEHRRRAAAGRLPRRRARDHAEARRRC